MATLARAASDRFREMHKQAQDPSSSTGAGGMASPRVAVTTTSQLLSHRRKVSQDDFDVTNLPSSSARGHGHTPSLGLKLSAVGSAGLASPRTQNSDASSNSPAAGSADSPAKGRFPLPFLRLHSANNATMRGGLPAAGMAGSDSAPSSPFSAPHTPTGAGSLTPTGAGAAAALPDTARRAPPPLPAGVRAATAVRPSTPVNAKIADGNGSDSESDNDGDGDDVSESGISSGHSRDQSMVTQISVNSQSVSSSTAASSRSPAPTSAFVGAASRKCTFVGCTKWRYGSSDYCVTLVNVLKDVAAVAAKLPHGLAPPPTRPVPLLPATAPAIPVTAHVPAAASSAVTALRGPPPLPSKPPPQKYMTGAASSAPAVGTNAAARPVIASPVSAIAGPAVPVAVSAAGGALSPRAHIAPSDPVTTGPLNPPSAKKLPPPLPANRTAKP